MIQTNYGDLPDGSLYLSELRVARRPDETLPSTCWSVWRRRDEDSAVCLIDWTGKYMITRRPDHRWTVYENDLPADDFDGPDTTLWAITQDQYATLIMLARHCPPPRAEGERGALWSRMVEAWRLNLSRDVTYFQGTSS